MAGYQRRRWYGLRRESKGPREMRRVEERRKSVTGGILRLWGEGRRGRVNGVDDEMGWSDGGWGLTFRP